MDGRISKSPLPAVENRITLNFPNAIQAIIDGGRVTRVEWDDANEYGFLKDGFLSISTRGSIHRWLVSDGDMLAEDWFVLPVAN